ncbi:hypothetical protein [Blastococcus brunescens]|uniref:EAL domain-containing protein n=1 Tax=Blastococcus brunescens TaxID=1564165 RepID=A0ABZ1AXH5_9ACTN|nr:hypothetical protein [Blastococcus sp. BMG 8361]WRL63266.1 hypothetical protein U6N30_26440 [Blastococcus sp. BMG 8361]
MRAAHTFGLTVVAEGVEEPAQLVRPKAQACDQAQGYLLYRPMRTEDAGALLRRAERPARSDAGGRLRARHPLPRPRAPTARSRVRAARRRRMCHDPGGGRDIEVVGR